MYNPEDIINHFITERKFNVEKLNIANFIAYRVQPSDLLALLSFVASSRNLQFTILTDLFAIDFLGRTPRFEIGYNLLSLAHNLRLLFKCLCGEDEKVPSVASMFSSACWYEREVFDMFGIHFENAHDLRRILTDYGFIGHPLRKDFPLVGHLQLRYDELLQQVIYEPVKLDQEFRDFDFSSLRHEHNC